MEIPQYDAIFIIGAQGSGKGTQGKLLAAKLGYFYWEMGEIFRDEVKKNTEFGQQIKSLIENGQLVPDENVIHVLEDRLPELIKHKRLVFDGVTRRQGQTEYLVNYLKQNGFTNLATIVINIPHEESVKRLLLRAHHEFRQDDTPEKIQKRLELYDQETKPVLDYLKSVSDYFEIDGVGTVEEITERINSALKI